MNTERKIIGKFKNICSKFKRVKLISLSTIDGFPIYTFAPDEIQVEADKLSAATSSIIALSMAASKQLIGSDFESTTIETKSGFMILAKTKYREKKCVLCFMTEKSHVVGQARYITLKLAKYIETVHAN